MKKTKKKTNGYVSDVRVVRVRTDLHDQLQTLKTGSGVPIERMVSVALRAFIASKKNQKLLRDATSRTSHK